MEKSPIPSIWRYWLIAVAAGVIALGILLLVWPSSGIFNLMIFYARTMPADFSADAIAYVEFVYGVLGAVLIGWMTTVVMLLRGPFRRGEPFAWWLLAVPVVVWFVPDTVFSLATGFWQNAVLNTLLFAAFAVPLLATRRHFQG